MWDIKNEDDAWEFGVFHAQRLVTGTPKSLGVPDKYIEFFKHGQHDCYNLSESRILDLADRWNIFGIEDA